MPADSTTSPDFGLSTLSIQSQGTTDTRSPTRVRSGTRAQLEKLCPRCNEWVGLGAKGNLYPFRLHQDGKQCRELATLSTRMRTEEPHGLSVASVSFGPGSPPTHPLSPCTPISPCQSFLWIVTLTTQSHPLSLSSLTRVFQLPSLRHLYPLRRIYRPRSSHSKHHVFLPLLPDAMVVDSPQAARPSLNIPPTFPSIASHQPQEQAVLVRSRSRCDGSMLRRSGKVGAWSPSENVPLSVTRFG